MKTYTCRNGVSTICVDEWCDALEANPGNGEARNAPTVVRSLHADLVETAIAAKALLAERDQLIRWQAEAVEALKRWDQVADLVPGSFLVPGANRSACVHAYIDHLQTANAHAEARGHTKKRGE